MHIKMSECLHLFYCGLEWCGEQKFLLYKIDYSSGRLDRFVQQFINSTTLLMFISYINHIFFLAIEINKIKTVNLNVKSDDYIWCPRSYFGVFVLLK